MQQHFDQFLARPDITEHTRDKYYYRLRRFRFLGLADIKRNKNQEFVTFNTAVISVTGKHHEIQNQIVMPRMRS